MWHLPNEYGYSAIHLSSPFPFHMFTFPTQRFDSNNFYTRENKAYTEDKVLIYNIFVYNIPKQLAEEDVRHYFSEFGNVTDVKLKEDLNRFRRGPLKMGFVSFAEPESACSVLRKKEHCLQGSRIGVKPGDSWNQPNADKACSPKKKDDHVASISNGSSKDVTTTNGGMHMLSLNDDCIETIFGYLKLKEQVRLARVCERFQDVFQMLCKRKFKHFVLNNIRGMTLWEKRDFFRFAGGDMASITGTVPYKNRERILQFIRKFCGKVKRIRLDESEMRNECLKKLLRGCPQLQELTLRNGFLNDSSIETMTHSTRLETLDLAGNEALTGEFLCKLVQLKVLNLFACCNIQTSHLMDICKSLPNLKSLDIRLCHRLEATLLNVIVEHCKELEILKLSCPEFAYERVALLPRLKQLELLCFSSDSEPEKLKLLAELVAHKAEQLEVLKIVSVTTLNVEHSALISELTQLKTLSVANNQLVNDDALNMFCKLQQLEDLTVEGCSNITNQALLNLVKSCQRLRRLDIQLCNQITVEFLLETIRFLKAAGKHKTPLVLMAYGTAIDYNGAIAYEEFKKAKEQSLISVVFHASLLKLGFQEAEDIYL